MLLSVPVPVYTKGVLSELLREKCNSPIKSVRRDAGLGVNLLDFVSGNCANLPLYSSAKLAARKLSYHVAKIALRVNFVSVLMSVPISGCAARAILPGAVAIKDITAPTGDLRDGQLANVIIILASVAVRLQKRPSVVLTFTTLFHSISLKVTRRPTSLIIW